MSIRLSHRSGEALAKLQRALRLPERPPLLRLALAQALLNCGGRLPEHQDSRGPEIPLKVVTAGQDLLIDALVVECLEEPFEAGDRKRVYKALVDFGLDILLGRFERMDGPSDFLVQMARNSVSD